MLLAPARFVCFSLAASLLAGAAFAQNDPNVPGKKGAPGTPAPHPAPSAPQNPRPVGPVIMRQDGVYLLNKAFGTFDPVRGVLYPPRRGVRVPNDPAHPHSPRSPFAGGNPGFPSFFRQFRNSDYCYANGLFTNGIFNYDWAVSIFPGGLASYPYYVPYFSAGDTYFSPYSYYSQSTPAFILAETVYQTPPQVIYVPIPLYTRGAYSGLQKLDIEDYYLNRAPKQADAPTGDANGAAAGTPRTPAAQAADPLVALAAAAIAKAWSANNIEALAPYINPKSQIAIYLRGKYQYSLDARDYLDLTRDALAATKTVKFELDAPVYKERGVYLLTGRHVYQNKDGAERTVYVNYVLELKEGKYEITQVGSAPDKVEEYKVGE